MTTRTLLVTSCVVAMATLVASQSHCSQFPEQTGPKVINITQSLQQAEGIGIIAGGGGFALLLAAIFIIRRMYTHRDSHLLDTFFDAGGNHNFAVVACAAISRWIWSILYSPGAGGVYRAGIAGQFWLSAATSVQLVLFAIVAAEFRIKAPGAKTFLQVIRCRFGSFPHLLVMVFAVVVNLFIMALVMAEGTKIFKSLTADTSGEVIALLLTAAAGIYTLIGGVGGGLYLAYFGCVYVIGIVLAYFFYAFYVNSGDAAHPWGFDYDDRQVVDRVCEIVQCARELNATEPMNLNQSMLTFSSTTGVYAGLSTLLGGFSFVFVNQAFWGAASTAKPNYAVWGYLTGGVVFFAIPFMMSFTFGMGNWVTGILQGQMPAGAKDIHASFIRVMISQLILGKMGDFLMAGFTLAAVVLTVSAQINSLAAIFMYDVYQVYVNPFLPEAVAMSTRWVPGNGEEIDQYVQYNRKNVFVRHAATIFFAILPFPAMWVMNALPHAGIGYPYAFMMVGVAVGGCVLPICMAVVWHRTTNMGVVGGVIVGLIAGVGAVFLSGSMHGDVLNDFSRSTSHADVFVISLGASFGVGGIVCFAASLLLGGPAKGWTEATMWDHCRRIDNPLKSWVADYAADLRKRFGRVYSGMPEFHEVRRQFKSAEQYAYVLGTLLTVLVLAVWPALMLLAGVLDCYAFNVWTMVAVVMGIIAAIYIGLLPPLIEIAQVLFGKKEQVVAQLEPVAVKQAVEPPPAPQVPPGVYISPQTFTVDSLDPLPPVHILPSDHPPRKVSQDDDEDSTIGENVDGLDVLQDPRKPTRRKTTTVNPPAPPAAFGGPVEYPLSLTTSLIPPCSGCGPAMPQYQVCATDIPYNGPMGMGGKTSLHLE